MTVWHAVAIGVKKAGQLPELPGAVNGAKDFAAWAEKDKRYKAHLITDESGPVKLADIVSVIVDILKNDFPDKLVIYFAGHGAQQGTTTPIWLLSNWDTANGEAVDVEKTSFMARRSGIPRAAIFADACRNVFGAAATVSPLPIFPPLPPSRNPRGRSQCDLFFSSNFDEISQEVKGDGDVKAFGVFTRFLLSALRGEEKEALEVLPGAAAQKAVTTQRLAKFLLDTVPLESGKIPGAVVQFPDILPVWLDPDRVYAPGPFAEAPSPPSIDPSTLARATSVGKGALLPKDLENLGLEPLPDPANEARRKVDDANQKSNDQLDQFTREFSSVVGRPSFETMSGLTIVGDEPLEAVASGIGQVLREDIFWENGAFHIRGRNDGFPRSIAVRLKSGNWIATALLPQFIGAILVKDGTAASLAYTPSANSRFHEELLSGAPYAEVIGRWNALMHQGTFAPPAELEANVGEKRQYKHVNPSLGIMASYAYERAGALDEIDSIAAYFAREDQPTPFDVAMLSPRAIHKDARGHLRIETAFPNGERKTATVAGSFPLLSRGWTLLDPEDEAISSKLLELRPLLVRSLWTIFSPAGGAKLAQLLLQGEL